MNKMPRQNTVNQSEIHHFQNDSKSWWDETGPFAPLHALNPIRMRFMVDVLSKNLEVTSKNGSNLLENIKSLDVGCGGGLVCEPFARLGATVTGIDADAQAIDAARAHADLMELSVTYIPTSIEEFRSRNKDLKFDVITALEIIEHVDAPEIFLAETAQLLKPGGVLFISTLNRTLKSFALGIVAAEYILGWVPKGTHHWRQFMRPSTLAMGLRPFGLSPIAASGITYRPITRDFALSPHDLDVNYIMAFKKT